jgi:hypothetical protein
MDVVTKQQGGRLRATPPDASKRFNIGAGLSTIDAACARTLYVTLMHLERVPDMAALAAHWAGQPATSSRERHR